MFLTTFPHIIEAARVIGHYLQLAKYSGWRDRDFESKLRALALLSYNHIFISLTLK